MHRLVLLGESPTEQTVTTVIDQIILPAATAAGATVPSHPESDTK